MAVLRLEPSNGCGPLPLGCHGSVKQFKWLITRWGKFKSDLGRSRIPIVDGAREEGKLINISSRGLTINRTGPHLTTPGRTRPHLTHPTVPLLWQVTRTEYRHCPL